MLEASRFDLRILAFPKTPSLTGGELSGHDFSVILVWDMRQMLDAYVSSPEALGRVVGAAIQDIAERTNEMMGA